MITVLYSRVGTEEWLAEKSNKVRKSIIALVSRLVWMWATFKEAREEEDFEWVSRVEKIWVFEYLN